MGLGNVLIINVASGRSIRGSLPSADAVGGRSIVARSVRRVRGYSIGTGVLLLLNRAVGLEMRVSERGGG